jgi:O-antigen/teichoic acid export membrane protein
MVLWISANVAAPVALALFLSAPELVPFLFGAQWMPAVPILRVLLLLAVLRPVWENVGALFIGSGQPRRVIEISALQLLILALLGAPLTLVAGALGMASAAVLAIGGGLAVAYWMLRRSLTIDIRSLLLGPVLASLLTVLAYWLLVRLIGSAHPLWFAIAWKIGWALFGFFLFSALLQPALFRERIAYVWRLLRGRADGRNEPLEENLL